MDNPNETNPNKEYDSDMHDMQANRQSNFYGMDNQQDPYSMNGYQQTAFFMNSIIDSLSGWMRFMGICTFICGILSCLGIITAVIGVPLIFAGIALQKSSKSLKAYKQYNNSYMLNEVFISMNKYFKIQGILTIVAVIVLIICIIVSVFFMIMAYFSFNNYYYY
ncbi:hypothetical protein LY28_01955 [Ruminiclostridium sufflavum DSM 19573]|uniref:DUF5362 domain-containing protein n=1 Tax=Ruminiclostridium sufflavum DSM 19573 TaxID=1121337 RepID=A0A318XLS5_9FIRM|nr:DUF5362 domain-containing protein [Ruminiclostridium sufflavum]PYG87586.1 hypothetical protein LY28_01955 [Ruminiclostridium sufflavum DSM 19573]